MRLLKPKNSRVLQDKTVKIDSWGPKDEAVRDRELPIWLVWALAENGNVTLRAIVFRQSLANQYRKHVLREGAIRAYIEQSTANHLYAGIFDVFSAVAKSRHDAAAKENR